jgi:epoxyqueuosine reductase
LTAVAAQSLARRLKEQALHIGFDAAGIAAIRDSDHAAFYQHWLASGHHGEMHYLARPESVHRRLNPQAISPHLQSALVVALRYDQSGDEEPQNAPPSQGIVARYVRGPDYHRTLKKRLRALLRWLEDDIGRPLPAARSCVDTAPVLERELARRAGLGWFGRNTMLLELELPADEPFQRDHCGRCNACVEACPTGALLGRDESGAPVMDARLCISYLTIEHRGPIPRALRPLIGNRIFGCDICQEVCPFNARAGASAGAGAGETENKRDLIELMGMDENEWEEFSRGSAIRRATRAGFLRNVAVALGNWGSEEAVPALVRALHDTEPLIRGHSAWALGRIPGTADREALQASLAAEVDPWVREELETALASAPMTPSDFPSQPPF